MTDYERGFIGFCGVKAVQARWGSFESRVDITQATGNRMGSFTRV